MEGKLHWVECLSKGLPLQLAALGEGDSLADSSVGEL